MGTLLAGCAAREMQSKSPAAAPPRSAEAPPRVQAPPIPHTVTPGAAESPANPSQLQEDFAESTGLSRQEAEATIARRRAAEDRRGAELSEVESVAVDEVAVSEKRDAKPVARTARRGPVARDRPRQRGADAKEGKKAADSNDAETAAFSNDATKAEGAQEVQAVREAGPAKTTEGKEATNAKATEAQEANPAEEARAAKTREVAAAKAAKARAKKTTAAKEAEVKEATGARREAAKAKKLTTANEAKAQAKEARAGNESRAAKPKAATAATAAGEARAAKAQAAEGASAAEATGAARVSKPTAAEDTADAILSFDDETVRTKDLAVGADGSARPPVKLLATGKAQVARARPVLPNTARQDARLVLRGVADGRTALVPRATRSVTYVQGTRVRTVIDYVFENPHPERLEATFEVELPADATPAGFSVFSGTQAVKSGAFFRSAKLLPPLAAGFVPPDRPERVAPRRGRGTVDWKAAQHAAVTLDSRARATHEAQVRDRAPSATLEWGGGQTFTARVFPLEARSLKRVVVAYEAPLAFDGRRARFDLVSPVAPGQVERQATVFVDTRHGRLVAVPPEARASKAGRWRRYDLSNPPAVTQFDLQIDSAQAVLRGRDPGGLAGDAFYARLAPFTTGGERTETKRAIFLVDTSASERPAYAARRAALLESILANDPTLQSYAVMLFDVRARWLHGPGFRENVASEREVTMAELRKVYVEGATSLEAAARELERQRAWAVDGAPTTVFLLSDGQLTWGEDVPARLVAENPVLKDVRVIAYRFDGESSRSELLSHLARSSGGRVITVSSTEEVSQAAQAHLRREATLIDVRVEGAPAADVVVDGDPASLYAGQVITVAGRLPSGGAARLRVVYRIGDRQAQVELPLVGASDELAVRAWADVYARALWAQRDPRLDRMLAALGQRYRLGNPRASFVMASPRPEARFNVEAELSAVSDLELMKIRSYAQDRGAAVGLDATGLSPEVKAMLTILRRASDGAAPRQPVLTHAPRAGGVARAAEEQAYRAARSRASSDLRVYERIARVRAIAGDPAGALRALSTPIERAPRDPAALRTVGYALLALAQYGPATEVFERLRRLRAFEAQSHLEEALALEAAGRADEAALRYELILHADAAERPDSVQSAAVLHYVRLLRRQAERIDEPKSLRTRLGQLSEAYPAAVAKDPDLRVTAHWSQGAVDVDLWIYEPDGARCSAERPSIPDGGRLLHNVTEGLGPEIYQVEAARPGAYDALVHYRHRSAPKLDAPAAILMVVDRPGAARDRRFVTRLLPDEDAVLLVRTERF